MSDFCSPDNPYNPKARDARDAERNRRKKQPFHIPLPKVEHCNFPAVREYDPATGVDSELAHDIAKKCGVRLVNSPDRGEEYAIKVPIPPVHPYHPSENQYGTRVKFEDALKTYDDWQSSRRKREKNHRRN